MPPREFSDGIIRQGPLSLRFEFIRSQHQMHEYTNIYGGLGVVGTNRISILWY